MYKFSIALQKPTDETYGIANLELCDGFFGKRLADLNGSETEDIRNNLIEKRQRIVLYKTDMPLSDTDAYIRFFRRAHLLQIENVSIDLHTIGGPENFPLLAEIIDMARGMGIRLVLEPIADCPFLDFDVYKEIASEATGLIFSPIEYLPAGKRPFLQVLYKCKIKDDIVFLRINDGIMHTAEPTPIEEGNAEVKECASNLLVRSFKGYFSITNYCGDIPDLLRRFTNTLKNL